MTPHYYPEAKPGEEHHALLDALDDPNPLKMRKSTMLLIMAPSNCHTPSNCYNLGRIQRYRYEIETRDTDTRYRYKIQIQDTDTRYRYGIEI